ncbi:Uncharacterized protein FKW44_011128, partial [Caligus rogercresseyi]
KTYLEICYQDMLSKIKVNIQDQPIWLTIDETTDVEGRYILNVVVGKVAAGSSNRAELVHSMILERTNAETVS